MSDKSQAIISVIVLIAGAFKLTDIFGVDQLTNFLNIAFAFVGSALTLYHTFRAHQQIAGLKAGLSSN